MPFRDFCDIETEFCRARKNPRCFRKTPGIKGVKWSKERTGEARKRLSATFTNKNGLAVITLAHGVDYGVYLELAHKKGGEEFAPFAVIGPVVRREAPKIMAEYCEMLGRALK